MWLLATSVQISFSGLGDVDLEASHAFGSGKSGQFPTPWVSHRDRARKTCADRALGAETAESPPPLLKEPLHCCRDRGTGSPAALDGRALVGSRCFLVQLVVVIH